MGERGRGKGWQGEGDENELEIVTMCTRRPEVVVAPGFVFVVDLSSVS